jgi:endosialidase-like protein
MKPNTFSLVLFALLTYFAPTLGVKAVVPAPGGGYPNFNTAEGDQALLTLTTGAWNTALGFQALSHDTTGTSNTATGGRALFSNTTGVQNTADGAFALFANSNGAQNSAFGWKALASNTTGGQNMANGYQALYSNAAGNGNTADGYQALFFNAIGNGNTAIGFQALFFNSTGSNNIALGYYAGHNVGLYPEFPGYSNIEIGNDGDFYDNNTIRIGDVNQTRTFIAGIRGVTTGQADAIPVVIDSAGQLGTTSSSRRFKREIKPMDKTSEAILALKPVTFHYKSDKTGTRQFGLIAEEVAEINPDLVVRDKSGEIYTVRYDAVNVMLLNEFLKEHRRLQDQEATIARLTSTDEKQEATIAKQQKQIDALTVGLQKVSAQLELNEHAPQTVKNTD